MRERHIHMRTVADRVLRAAFQHIEPQTARSLPTTWLLAPADPQMRQSHRSIAPNATRA